MYKTFYELDSNPFSLSPDPSFICATPATREALACLEHGIAARKGFIALTGEVGTGKTTLLRQALDRFHNETIHTSFVFNPRLDILDLLEFVLADFGIPGASQTKAGRLMLLNKWLIDCFARKEICVLVIDEAQNLSYDMLEEIRLLTNLETSSEKLLQIVLSGQPEFEEILRSPRARQLRQRIPLWCRTYPLTLEETFSYITHRLVISGTTESIFTDESVTIIHHYSAGIPRTINLIAEHALIFGFVDRVKIIGASIVFDVLNDLAQVRNEPELANALDNREKSFDDSRKISIESLDVEEKSGR